MQNKLPPPDLALIDIDKIDTHNKGTYVPSYDKFSTALLTGSIQDLGVIVPITVLVHEDLCAVGDAHVRYDLVDGRNRLRTLKAQGETQTLAIVYKLGYSTTDIKQLQVVLDNVRRHHSLEKRQVYTYLAYQGMVASGETQSSYADITRTTKEYVESILPKTRSQLDTIYDYTTKNKVDRDLWQTLLNGEATIAQTLVEVKTNINSSKGVSDINKTAARYAEQVLTEDEMNNTEDLEPLKDDGTEKAPEKVTDEVILEAMDEDDMESLLTYAKRTDKELSYLTITRLRIIVVDIEENGYEDVFFKMFLVNLKKTLESLEMWHAENRFKR